MRWTVEAADTRNGSDTHMTVEALTAADAERIARYNGLLVSKVYRAGPDPAPLVGYRGPAAVPSGPPEYREIVRGAAWVRRLGLFALLLGSVGLLAVLGVFSFRAVRGVVGGWQAWRSWLPGAAAFALRWGAASLGLVVAGVVLRLLGACALAQRDVARNTYRPDAAA